MVAVDQILEPVADAVSQLVELSVATGDIPDLTDLSILVQGSSANLVNVALEMSKRSTDETLRADIPLAAERLGLAANNLVTSCRQLKVSPSDSTARQLMVASCKAILDSMTDLLTCTDDAEVRRILKSCQDSIRTAKMLTTCSTMSDLVSGAGTMSQVQVTLLKLCKQRLDETSHLVIHERLESGIELLKKTTPLLISACKVVCQNTNPDDASPKESQDIQVAALIESVREIATVVQLRAKDMPREEDLLPGPQSRMKVTAAATLRHLGQYAAAGDRAGTDKAAKELEDQLREQVALARLMASLCSDPIRKKELLDAADALERLTPQIIAAAKALAADPNNPDKKRALQNLQRKMNDGLNVLNGTMQGAMEEEVARLLAENPHLLTAVLAAAMSGNQPAFVKAVKALGANVASLDEVAKILADRCEDPKQRDQILLALDKVVKGLPGVITAAKTVLLNTENEAAREHLAAVASAWQTHVNTLAAALRFHKGLEEDLVETRARADHDLDRLRKACRDGDVALANELVAATVERMTRLAQLGRAFAETCPDPVQKAAVLAECVKIEGLLDPLKRAAKRAAENPNDPEAQRELNRLIAEAKKANAALEALVLGRPVGTVETEIAAIAALMPALMDELKGACRTGNALLAQELLDEITNGYHRQIDLAREAAESCTDPVRKAAILKNCDLMEELLTDLADAVKNAVANPNDPAAQKRLADLLDRLVEVSKIIEGAVNGDYTPPPPLPPPELEEDSEEDEPMPELSSDPIMAASQKIAHQAGKWSAEGNEMVALAGKIGEMMAILSEAARSGDKAALIQAARNIADHIKGIAKMAKEIAANCKDPRLKQNLLTVAESVPTIAVQLKIIAAVKAADDSNDSTTFEQLVTCAQNLADAVVKTVDASKSASITSMKAAGAVAVAAIKWKKKSKAKAAARAGPSAAFGIQVASKVKKAE